MHLALTAGEAHDNRLVTTLTSDLKSGAMVLATVDTTPIGSEVWLANVARRQTAEAEQGLDLLQPDLYRARNLVEQLFNKIEQWATI